MGPVCSNPLPDRQLSNIIPPRSAANEVSHIQGGKVESLIPAVKNAGIVVVKLVGIGALKYLLDMTHSIPLASGFINVAERFCESVQAAFENWEAFGELYKSVEESCTLNLHLIPFTEIKDSEDAEYARFVILAINELKIFFGAIDRVSDLAKRKYTMNGLTATSAANAIKRVLFTDIDRKEIEELAKALNNSRNKIINYATLIGTTAAARGLKNEREQLRDEIATKIPNISSLFADDIQRHTENFVPGSRAWLVTAVNKFLNEPGGSKLFWLKSDAGMGKSALASWVVTMCQGANCLLGFFFCRFDHIIRSNGRNLIMALAAQIAENLPACREEIERAAVNITDKSTVRNLMTVLVEEPLKHVTSMPTSNMLLVIDALDELHLQGSQERADILELLKHLIKVLPPFVKVLLTSRPERDILEALYNFAPHTIEMGDQRHLDDLKAFIRSKLRGHLVNENDLKEATELLFKKSGGYFVYIASIAAMFEGDRKWTMAELECLPDGLDGVYRDYFARILEVKQKDVLYDVDKVRPLLSLLVAMQRPLQPFETAKLLGLRDDDEQIIHLNDAVNAMFPLRNGHYVAFHKSVVDYLVKKKTDKPGCLHHHTSINPLDGHVLFASGLPKQIAKIKACDDKTSKLDWTFPESGSYAVAHLLDHLYMTGTADDKLKARYLLFQLPWLMRVLEERGVASLLADFRKVLLADGEAIAGGQLKLLHDGIYLITTGTLPEWLPLQIIGRIRPLVADVEQKQRLPLLGVLVDECEKWFRRYQPIFPLTFQLASPGGALQTTLEVGSAVASVAVLSDGRVVSGGYKDNTFRVWDLSTRKCVQVLEGHTMSVAATSLAVLSGGRLIVGGWNDDIVRILNSSTGECMQTLEGHSKKVTSIAVLSDGRVVSASMDYTIRVWDPSTGECARVLEGHTLEVMTLAVLSDGKVVSGSMDKTVRVWDLSTGECVHELEGHTDSVTTVAVLLDGRVVSGSWDNTVRVWDLSTGECMHELEGHTKRVTCLAVLLDGSVVIGSKDSAISVWDPKAGKCTRVLKGHSGMVTSLAVLSDGRLVSGGCHDNTVRVWDLSVRENVRVQEGHSGMITSLALLLDGRVVSASKDKTLRVWDPSTGECARVLKGHVDMVTSLAVLSDGRVVSGSKDKTVRVWDLSKGKCMHVLEGHTDRITSVAVHSDGRVVSWSWDKTVRVWDLSKGKCVRLLDKGLIPVESLVVLSDGRVVRGSSDNTIRVKDPSTGECTQVLQGHTFNISALALTPDGRVISGSWDNTVRVWDPSTGVCVHVLEGHIDMVTSIAVLSDRRVVSASMDNTIRVWDPSTGKCARVLEGHTREVMTLAVLSDGKVVSGSMDNTVRLWHVLTGECVHVLEGYAQYVTSLTVLSDGRVVIGYYDNAVRVWDLSTGECVRVLEDHPKIVAPKAVVSDGRVVSGSWDNMVRMWDLSTGECLHVLEGHTKMATSVVVLSDGRVVSGSYDSTVRVWDLTTGECVRIMEGHTGPISSLTALSDGRVVSRSWDETLRVWDPSTGECVWVQRLDNVICPPSVKCALTSFGLPHVSACCELTLSSGLGDAGFALGTDSGEVFFFTLLVSMDILKNS